MLQALFDFFYELFVIEFEGDSILQEWTIVFPNDFSMDVQTYFAFLCSIISLVFIVVLCCLFVYKIIKLIGGLIR